MAQEFGSRRDVFVHLLRKRFPSGRFTLAQAREVFLKAHRRYYPMKPYPSWDLQSITDILREEGALFEHYWHEREGSLWAGNPSTNLKNVVTMPSHTDFIRLKRDMLACLVNEYAYILERSPTAWYGKHIDEYRKELAELNAQFYQKDK